jgi:hypothetical protein
LKKSPEEGVSFEDYQLLTGRIDRMESSISSIVTKVKNFY